jgi:type II secretory pathway pseudopilin PulG
LNRRGISLIVLVITIIVIVILAGAVIINLANNGPVMQASQATFKANLAEYNNELSLYISNQYLLNDGKFNSDSLNALTPAEVKDIIKGITAEDAQKIRVIDGKLAYIGADQNEIVWAEQMDVSLDVPYVKNGLVLWYDGIYNGGFGVHNDNLSVDKGVWKDLSGNGNDGSLQSFDYNTSNGWINNGLKFNGRPNLVNFNLNIPNKHTIEFIVMPRKVAYNGVFSVASNLERTYSCGVHSSNFLFYNTSLSRRK